MARQGVEGIRSASSSLVIAPSGHRYSNFSLETVGGSKAQCKIDREPSKFSTSLIPPSTDVGQWSDQGFKDACEEEAIARKRASRDL